MVDLYIQFPDNFLECLEKYKASLKPSTTPEPSVVQKLRYDDKKGRIYFGQKFIDIPLATNQRVVCEALFALPSAEWLKDSDVRDKYSKATESSFYNAVRAINTAAKDMTGIDEIIEYQNLNARIKTELLEL